MLEDLLGILETFLMLLLKDNDRVTSLCNIFGIVAELEGWKRGRIT